MMKNWFLNLTALFLTSMLYSQGVITGSVIDGDYKAPLMGASVVVKGTTRGATTDMDGKFSLHVDANSGVLEISYVGYATKTIPYKLVNKKANIRVTLDSDQQTLGEVVVTGSSLIDVVKDRQTPIAVSTIPVTVIQEKLGNQDIPELMKHTPSVQVASQAGGYGESKMNLRGFSQDNTAYLLNGQPINGMDNGSLYWSNWQGIADIANAIQIQRGLGSSKLAISSVGGTVNIVTKATDKNEGGFVRATVANDMYVKTSVGYNTGMSEKGFGMSIMLANWQGNGYNDGTKGQGQTYFLSFGYKPNEKHSFNFLITGAPQSHDQNSTKPISDYLKYGYKYNANWGYRNGKYFSARRNFYHKPVLNLNWDWKISDDTSLATVLYASIGRGGGVLSSVRSQVDPTTGLINFDAIDAKRRGKTQATFRDASGLKTSNDYLLFSEYNQHFWYGGVTNFQHKLSDNFTVNIGADVRRYEGSHFKAVTDLFGFSSYLNNDRARIEGNNIVTETFTTNPWNVVTHKVPYDQRVSWDYDETITYGGIFGQIEYTIEKVSAYMQGSFSRQQHVRIDRYQYRKDFQESNPITNNGFNIKGGVNYKINTHHNVFVNAGYYSRQPYHRNLFLNYTNEHNPLAKNERILGIELGYQYSSPIFNANLNLYRTSWKDRVTASSSTDPATGLLTYTSNSGVGQLHKGVELDFKAKPIKELDVRGFVSYGHWIYDENALKRTYDNNLTLITEVKEDVDGAKVGDAPQFQLGLGVDIKPVDRFKVDIDWKYNDKLYARVVVKDNIQLPSYQLFDAGVSYKLPLKDKMYMNFRLNVNNVLDYIYLSEIAPNRGNIQHIDANTKETYKGIDVRNLAYFGEGRTWSFNVAFNF